MWAGNDVMDPAVHSMNPARARIHEDTGMMNNIDAGGLSPEDRFAGFRALLHPEMLDPETDAVVHDRERLKRWDNRDDGLNWSRDFGQRAMARLTIDGVSVRINRDYIVAALGKRAHYCIPESSPPRHTDNCDRLFG